MEGPQYGRHGGIVRSWDQGIANGINVAAVFKEHLVFVFARPFSQNSKGRNTPDIHCSGAEHEAAVRTFLFFCLELLAKVSVGKVTKFRVYLHRKSYGGQIAFESRAGVGGVPDVLAGKGQGRG